jgi:CIC family chloride channel protein
MPSVALARKHLAYASAIVATGLLAAAFAVLFRGALHLAFTRLFRAPDVLRAFQTCPPALRIAIPTVGGALAAALGVFAARRAGGHGVAEVLEAVVLGRGRVSLSTTAWKATGSFAAMVTGGSVGREGPLLQFGAAAGTWVAERLGLDAKQGRALVAAGTAAGFAAAYNTPIAAVLFVLEVVTGVISLDVVLPVMVATALATAATRLAIGPGPLYGLRGFSLGSPVEFSSYAGLGIVSGLVGAGFMSLLGAGARAASRLSVPAPARGAIGGLAVGICVLGLPEVAGNGYEALQQMLDARFAAGTLALLLVAKALATTASVSTGSPGGVFTPSMFLGGAAGGLLGAAVHAVAPAHGPLGGYVLVGMAGAIAATTHAPVMAAALAFELSGDYGIVLPLLVATVLATAVARRLRPDSIYTEELRRRGIPWEGTLAQRLARAVRAADIMEKDPFTVEHGAPVGKALDILARTRARVVFVVGGPAVGAIDLHVAAQIWSGGRQTPPGQTCGELAAPVPMARPDDSLLELGEKLAPVDWGEIPIVGAARGRLDGVVTRRALVAAFDRELLQRDLLYTRVVSFEGQNEAADYLELPRGHRVEIIAPPAVAVGAPVDVAGTRARRRVTILGVRRSARGEGAPEWLEPETVRVTSDSDRWLVVGPAQAIEDLRRAASTPD